jgi:hypothetical protein
MFNTRNNLLLPTKSKSKNNIESFVPSFSNKSSHLTNAGSANAVSKNVPSRSNSRNKNNLLLPLKSKSKNNIESLSFSNKSKQTINNRDLMEKMRDEDKNPLLITLNNSKQKVMRRW